MSAGYTGLLQAQVQNVFTSSSVIFQSLPSFIIMTGFLLALHSFLAHFFSVLFYHFYDDPLLFLPLAGCLSFSYLCLCSFLPTLFPLSIVILIFSCSQEASTFPFLSKTPSVSVFFPHHPHVPPLYPTDAPLKQSLALSLSTSLFLSGSQKASRSLNKLFSERALHACVHAHTACQYTQMYKKRHTHFSLK